MTLPFVTNEVGFNVAHGLKNDDKTNIVEGLEKIKKTNPAIAEFITKWSKQARDLDAKYHSALCGILVYKLLESQAEAEKLNNLML